MAADICCETYCFPGTCLLTNHLPPPPPPHTAFLPVYPLESLK